jgi:hypothetical protein
LIRHCLLILLHLKSLDVRNEVFDPTQSLKHWIFIHFFGSLNQFIAREVKETAHAHFMKKGGDVDTPPPFDLDSF